ncbi:transketolase [Vallitalea sediminicola]
MLNQKQINELKKMATKIRMHVVEETYHASSGHPGGALSITDVLTVLFFNEMNVDVNNSKWENRDRFVLSKGHSAPAYYGVLAEKGYFPKDELTKLRSFDSFLQGHPDMNKINGVDMSTGSLGQGLSAANGMALMGKKKNFRVYCVLGDGEIEEGQVWEAAMTAAHYKLNNLIAFVDNNGLQIDGEITKIMNPQPISDKFASFGWNVISIDGNNIEQILEALEEAKKDIDKPTVIICDTVKGKGVSYMENKVEWHGAAPNKELRDRAIEELEEQLNNLEVL